jgi:hypothetical protein
MRERGQKVLTVTREAMTHALFRDGPAREVDLPDDVRIEALWHTPYGEGYQMRVSSGEWDPDPEGTELDHINPTIHDVAEVDVWLGQYDMDHLQHGQPVFKDGTHGTQLVLRFKDYDDA